MAGRALRLDSKRQVTEAKQQNGTEPLEALEGNVRGEQGRRSTMASNRKLMVLPGDGIGLSLEKVGEIDGYQETQRASQPWLWR